MSEPRPTRAEIEAIAITLWPTYRAQNIREDEAGCRIWTGALNAAGYGYVALRGFTFRTHRIAYLAEAGPIPTGLVIDHLCRVRSCANPEHLEPVTDGVNALRGMGPTAQNAAKTECIHGHPFDAENTSITNKGYRRCRTCARLSSRDYRRRRAAERMAAA